MPWTVDIIQNTDTRNTGTVTATYTADPDVRFTYSDLQLRFAADTPTTNFATRAKNALAAYLADKASDDAVKAAIIAKLEAP